MNKFSFIKHLASFVIALALGLGMTKIFSNPDARNGEFSSEEAVSHLHRKVQSWCNAKFVTTAETKGKTVSTGDLRGVYRVAIDWDYSIRGRHEVIWYDKKVYEKCIVEVGEVER